MLEREPTPGGVHHGTHRVVGHRQDARVNSESTGKIIADARQAFPGAQPARAFHVQRQVAVAEAEPGLAAQGLEHRHEGPGLVGPAPSGLGVVAARQRIEHGVEVGRDMQAQMLEVVAGVDHDAEPPRPQVAVQAERQLGAAHAAA